VQNARHVYLTGIGSSWRAALTAAPLFSQRGCPVYLQDAAELLQFSTIPSGAVIVAISRQHRNRQSIGKGSRLRCDRDWRNQLGGCAAAEDCRQSGVETCQPAVCQMPTSGDILTPST
jgi:hypothetical protein